MNGTMTNRCRLQCCRDVARRSRSAGSAVQMPVRDTCMNAFTDGSEVHLDVVLYEGNCFPFFPDTRWARL